MAAGVLFNTTSRSAARGLTIVCTGKKRPESSMFRAEWLDVAREALTGIPNAALRTTKSSYRWTIAKANGDLKVDTMHSTSA